MIAEFSEMYVGQFPVVLCRPRTVGLEREFPVIFREDATAFDVRVIYPILMEMGWKPVYGHHYQDEIQAVVSDGVCVSTDAGYCTLEITLCPLADLIQVKEKFDALMSFLAEIFQCCRSVILGYGIQPISPPSEELWLRNGRHEIMRTNFPGSINKMTITASNQMHVDITRSEIVPMTNTLNALTGLMLVLCANAPIWQGVPDSRNCFVVREDLWRFSDLASEERIGVPPYPFKDIGHFLEYMLGLTFLIAEKAGMYFSPRMTFAEYLCSNGNLDAALAQYFFHEATVWPCFRPRASYATLEARPFCAQPPQEHMVADALTLGLAENLAGAQEIVSRYPWEIWRALRQESMFGGFKITIQGEPVTSLLEELLTVAQEGLRLRGFGEEVFLDPLWERLQNRRSPALHALALFHKGGIQALSEYYAYP